MLGIAVSERTVSRILRTLARPPSQSWKTFLNNHVGQIFSVDFFTVPTITLKVLYVFVVLAHRRREVVHFNVTEHPRAEWIAQQVVEACAYRDAPKYLIRDRDRVYGSAVRKRLQALRIQEVLIAPASPWQNCYVERLDWIDSPRVPEPRRDSKCSSSQANAHLYFDYYQRSRTHLAPGKDCPTLRAVLGQGKIIRIPYLGGLHHCCKRIAA
ncbi:MAG: integrase core domain-containing protein [Bryobacteraceae bacterium]